MEKSLQAPIRYLKGIGPKRAISFEARGVSTIEDLLYYFPFRYEDRRNFTTISKLEEGKAATIRVEVLASGEHRSFRRRNFSITEIAVADDTGKIFCVWFNQPYLKNYFKSGVNLILYGKAERYGAKLQMNSPEFEIISESENEPLSIGRIVPIYSLPQAIGQRYLRQMVKNVLDEYLPALHDFLPYDLRQAYGLSNLAKSILEIHFPESLEGQQEAYRRLSFDEFFLFQLPLALRKSRKKEKLGIAHKTEGNLVHEFMEKLPFKLTSAQEAVIEEIKHDMASPTVMQRLLQGDVGSGKTIVAFIASLMAIQGGYQVAFMVPTEILARQHYENIVKRTAYGVRREKAFKIGLLVSSQDKQEKEKTYADLKAGKIDLIIGTHALLEKKTEFKNLGLVVIDEQHKFGVGQRALLPEKGINPDVLIMTATPIPRTLAITLYGDLDVSVINSLPPGRKPIVTKAISEEKKSWLYSLLEEKLRLGQQAYIIYPVIEESFALDIEGAKKMFAQLKEGALKDYSLGLIHGRLKDREQENIMAAFKSGKTQVLVATTILEVGIDVPNATVMVIEHAERFGLSQLHQLRGRIGRGSEESFCVLVWAAETQDSKARIEAMVKYSDGFAIAEQDLKIRGPGEFFGSRQHGLSELKIGNPLAQMQLLKKAREAAIALIKKDPQLAERQNLALKEKLLQRFPEYEKLIVVG
ncbi:MAG: ATP-dependent DNA helicase RecG [Candidatus Omnitrophica bacterium]|nr:ATP-dependent DNA helicase RecG [Candidatus Omnitrophota bacterium]MDD5653821.1 ATP-dependent DNA helicase RecG [Candidatus Omnitrophota bacterium]